MDAFTSIIPRRTTTILYDATLWRKGDKWRARDMHRTDDRVFDQDCATYLRSLGITAMEGARINAPFRDHADSESFSMNGPLWNDYAGGNGGNVWQLALLMKRGDRKEAMRSLCHSAGVAFIEGGACDRRLDDRQKPLAVPQAQSPPKAPDAHECAWDGGPTRIEHGFAGQRTMAGPPACQRTRLPRVGWSRQPKPGAEGDDCCADAPGRARWRTSVVGVDW